MCLKNNNDNLPTGGERNSTKPSRQQGGLKELQEARRTTKIMVTSFLSEASKKKNQQPAGSKKETE
jgi:hypothetical protein